jgi:hypothetical protein
MLFIPGWKGDPPQMLPPHHPPVATQHGICQQGADLLQHGLGSASTHPRRNVHSKYPEVNFTTSFSGGRS